MRPLQVVVPHELGEDRPEMVLVQDDEVIEALSTKCPEKSFDDRVRTRAGDGA